MATWGSTTFTEFVGDQRGPDEQYMEHGARVVRLLDVIPGTVKARMQALADFLGYNQVVGNYISRATPLPYNYSPSSPSGLPKKQYLYAANIVRGQGIDPNGKTLTAVPGPLADAGFRPPVETFVVGGDFARYRYTVEFTSRTYDIKDDSAVVAVAATMSGGSPNVPVAGSFPPSPITGLPDEGQRLAGEAFTTYPDWPPAGSQEFSTASRYITRWFRPSCRTRVIPQGTVKWLSDNNPIREGFPFNETTGSLRYTWHCVPEAGVPLKAIQNCTNGINNFWFDGFAPNTLLFKNMDFTRYIGPLGDVLYDIVYYFSWLPNRSRGKFPAILFPTNIAGRHLGWNWQLRVKQVAGVTVLDYDYIVDDQTTPDNSPYPGVDLTSLFRPD